MIPPTIGRIVWYTPALDGDQMIAIVPGSKQPLASIVCYVWSDRMVNLSVIDHNGHHHPRTSVDLLQDGDTRQTSGRYCEWMPFQKGQARRLEEEKVAPQQEIAR